ncbi:chemotaxis protein CheW [Gilvimarinus agarilyticus]|uniref:chemotaxis protein CheW n=1 Tax=Gilvimarinus agarilyticus TaxID=679259 RepID=UPI0005A29F3A|nr:chemotaxis protein CheW [Gilvimarinus agarilyticus]
MSSANVNELLQGYFDELLSEGPASSEPLERESQKSKPELTTPETARDNIPPATVVAEALEGKARRDQLQQLLYSARASLTQHMSEPEVLVPPTAPVAPVPDEVVSKTAVTEQTATEVSAPEPESQSVLDQALQWHANGRPVWAQESFEVLLFTVSGLTLAVPLIALGQIQPLTDELTPLFGQADWFMGLQPTPSGKVRTVNTAKFVMPERYDPAFVESAQYVVSISGVPWGLAVDNVEQPMRLEPEDVKWRSSRSKRPWLAGTVKDHMCALLDIPMMGKLLTDADRNSRK